MDKWNNKLKKIRKAIKIYMFFSHYLRTGPFQSSEMAEWFSAGYFTMNLLVKRGCDEEFMGLGDVIKRWGRVPFTQGPEPPPFAVSRGKPAGLDKITTFVGISSTNFLQHYFLTNFDIYFWTKKDQLTINIANISVPYVKMSMEWDPHFPKFSFSGMG